MKRLVSPLLLVLTLSLLSTGWRSQEPAPPDSLMYPVSMTLAANRLLVSDSYTGLHVYDISNLSAPAKLIRIPVRYNQSSAVKGDIIYTNSYYQLQAIRVTGDSYQVVARIGSEYPRLPPPDGAVGGSGYGCACTNTYAPMSSPTPTGGGSSYATFALVDDYLYRVVDGTLHVYDVANQDKPKEVATNRIGWDVETLFPSQNFLFIGGWRGMYIFDRSDPQHPKELAQIQHTRACDPVVVSGPTAYVTLRGSGQCGGASDELLCVSIKDPRQPRIVGEKVLTTPYGLAVKDSRLYVSHGDNGYSLLDVSHPAEPSVTATWAGQVTRDFIWSGDTLFVLGDHNVAIYDVSNPLAPRLLSTVEPGNSL